MLAGDNRASALADQSMIFCNAVLTDSFYAFDKAEKLRSI